MNPELTLQFVGSGSQTGGERIGYGRLGTNLARALRSRGVDVYDGQNIPEHGVRIGTAARADATDPAKRIKDTNVICWVSSPVHAQHGWLSGQHGVMFTMYETTWLPEAFRESLHNFAQIIVPSAQNVELFSQYHDNVTEVPLGVDPAVWHYEPRPDAGVFFNFMIGGSGPRKGGDLAQRAFMAAFPTDPKDGPLPRLIIKSPRGGDDLADAGRMSVVGGYLSPEEEVDLYRTIHCYLQPSRGEGFGLQPLQAIAQGIPTILTDAHGHEAFAHLGYGIGSALAKTPVGGFLHGDHPDMMWWEPNFDELVDRMRDVYTHYHHAAQVARASAHAVAGRFTWDHVAANFVAAVGPERLTAPYSGDGSWVTPTEKLYLVRVDRPHIADIGGKTYQFQPFDPTDEDTIAATSYWESSDVKRVLFDANKLDPSCFDTVGETDNGLLPEQLGQVEEYSAAHSYCDHCGQRLNTVPTRADDILAEMEAELTA